jgi:hypothetical protein
MHKWGLRGKNEMNTADFWKEKLKWIKNRQSLASFESKVLNLIKRLGYLAIRVKLLASMHDEYQ